MKNMKKFRAIAVGLVLALVLGTAAMAASGKTVTIFPGVTITVNGTKSTPVDVNGNEVETFIYNNSTYVPLRYFSELMGVNVEWDEATNTVKLSGVPAIYKAGTYTATAKGFGGDVTATVTVDEFNVVDVTLAGAGETPAIGGAALPTLAESAKAKGAKLDAVAGATATSNAVKVAVADALAQATVRGATKAPVADGTYATSVVGHSINGPMAVTVTIKGGKLADIAVGENTETPEILKTVTDRLIPRILENQSLDVDAIGGATASSNAVLQAVGNAIEQAGGKRSEWYSPVEKKTDTVKLEGYDVIVVGLGGSGMSSYISAAENGAAVFGMETAGKIGGTSATVSGPMAINPKTKMDAQNNGEKFLEEEDLITDWLEYCRGDAKEEMVRLFVNESGETMDWLINNYEFSFGDIRAFFHPKMWKVWAVYQGSKTDMMTAAVEKAKAMNAKNDYKLELTATELILENGQVKGVKATYWDGTTYEVYGKNVILATGGFLGNSEMTEKYMGGTFNFEAMTQNNGAGVNMGLSAGGALYNEDMPGMVHMCNVKNIIKTDELTANQKAALTALVMNTEAPIIGINGETFMETSTNLAFDNWKGGDTYFVLYTQAQLDEIKAKGLANPASAMRGQGGKLEANTPVADLDEILAVGTKYSDVFKADSVAELAKLIGVDADKLAKAADGMTGPIYAIAGAGYYYGTCGGLEVNEKMNVVKEDGTAIANLFAVGQDSMGVLFSNQDAYVTYGGAAQGWVLTSGRLAGANAAANK